LDALLGNMILVSSWFFQYL